MRIDQLAWKYGVSGNLVIIGFESFSSVDFKRLKNGSERYKKKIPLGFKDSGRASAHDDTQFYNNGLYYERHYGDLILWKQLLNKAKSQSIENVIFITDDAKEDWWYKISSNGNKTIGPLSELQAEIYRDSNIKNFHMYGTSMFLEDGKSNLAVDESESSIEDASTPHIIENHDDLMQPKHISTIADSLRSSLINTKNLRELAERANKVSYFDNEKYRELAERASKISTIVIKRHREIAEAASRINTFDNEKYKEMIERANKSTLLDSERMREVFESQKRIQNEDLTNFNKWLLKNKDKGDSSYNSGIYMPNKSIQ